MNPWKISLIPTIGVGIFWLIWYLVKGSIPTTRLVGKSFVISYNRVLDVPSIFFILPIYWLNITKTAEAEDSKGSSVSPRFAISLYLTPGLMIGLFLNPSSIPYLTIMTILAVAATLGLGLVSGSIYTFNYLLGYGLGSSLRLGIQQGFAFALAHSLLIVGYPAITLRKGQKEEEKNQQA